LPLGCLLALVAISVPASADPAASVASVEILERYLAANQTTKAQLNGYTMEVEMDAQLPRLKKQGKLHAFRHISRIGRITYDALRWAGDNTIKTDVIARYLKAETQAQEGPTDVGITPANYKFKYKGLAPREGRQVHVFQVSPHKKRVGLFKGEIWVDPDTYLPVRESGVFVKNPSMFLKKIEFTRDYEIKEGIAFPLRIDSRIDTRIVGRAELNISFSNFKRNDTETVAAAGGENQ
jgi:hypothetical protein